MSGILNVRISPLNGPALSLGSAVVGDEIAAGIGEGLRDLWSPNEDWSVDGSGLRRAHPCDWLSRIRDVAAVRRQLTIIAIGSHDADAPPDHDYRNRACRFLMPLHEAGLRFLVLSVPAFHSEDPRNGNRIAVNAVLRAAADHTGGQFLELAQPEEGHRARDGNHFTGDGNRAIARQVLAAGMNVTREFFP